MSDTQRDRVLALLRQRPICGIEFLQLAMPRYAARIHELRQDGYRIDTQTCNNPHHWHKSRQIEYVLIPATHDGQLTMDVS